MPTSSVVTAIFNFPAHLDSLPLSLSLSLSSWSLVSFSATFLSRHVIPRGILQVSSAALFQAFPLSTTLRSSPTLFIHPKVAPRRRKTLLKCAYSLVANHQDNEYGPVKSISWKARRSGRTIRPRMGDTNWYARTRFVSYLKGSDATLARLVLPHCVHERCHY